MSEAVETSSQAGSGEGRRAALGEWVRSLDRVAWMVLGITLLALVTRLVDLGVRAAHHDESLHLAYSWYFAEGRGYRHDPLMHGPLQFHLMAAFFKLFGDSEFIGRLPHALAGTALVFTPLLFRRYLGNVGVILGSTFFLVSPVLLYYSRFARNEPLVGLFTVLMLLAVLKYRDTGQFRWLVVFSANLALQFAAKETGYIVAALFLLYFNFATAHALFWEPRRARGETASILAQLRGGLWLIPSAWVFALAWPALRGFRERRGWHERPREADLLVLTATLVLPLLAALVEFPLLAFDVEITASLEQTLGWSLVPLLLVLSAALGLWWGRLDWAICWAVFTAILLPLYGAWGTHIEGIAGVYWTSLDYWIDQQEVRRGTQPWFYYLMMMPLYESLVLIPGLIGGAWLTLRRRDPVAALLTWWFLGMLVALSYAGEKMPWLTFHITIPLCLLAAYWLGRLAPRALEAARAGRGSSLQWVGGAVGGVLLVALFALAVRTGAGLALDHPDTPVEPLIYVQTSPDVPPLAERIVGAVRDGEANRVVIETGQSLTWPWAWYLRHLPVLYVERSHLDDETLNPDDIVITNTGAIPTGRAILRDYERAEPYVHRWWFLEARYRAITWGGLWEGITDLSLVDDWVSFLWNRGDEDAIGALNGEVYFPRGVGSVTP